MARHDRHDSYQKNCTACRRRRERPRPYSVRLICHCERTGTDRERTTPNIARRKQKDPSIKSAFEHVTAVWAALADQVERIGREKFPSRAEENNHSVRQPPRPAI